jgi:hypothetical protein
MLEGHNTIVCGVLSLRWMLWTHSFASLERILVLHWIGWAMHHATQGRQGLLLQESHQQGRRPLPCSQIGQPAE